MVDPMRAFFSSRSHSHREDKRVYTPEAFLQTKFTSALLDLESKHPVLHREQTHVTLLTRRSEKTEVLHVEVLLRLLNVPFNFSVYVKVKLLGHR